MKNEEILQKTRTFVETCMSGNDPSHDFCTSAECSTMLSELPIP